MRTLNVSAYDISFEIDFRSMTFIGREDIHIENAESNISLDSFGLSIQSVRVDGADCKFSLDEKANKLNIEGVDRVRIISILFDGKASEGALHGLYKASYGTGYWLTTDLEPIGARRFFPCIDNPSFKAVFNVDVVTEKDLKVIFNTPLHKKEELGGKARFIFEPTPRMSTYLFYLGVGNFDEISVKEANVEFIAATPPGQASRGKYGLENAVKFLRAYEDYFSIKYPLQKLHLIAVPEYPSGAMENWGAITFREVALLVDQNTSISGRRRVVEVIGHEIAHMWFGDLVTMKWWNDLWLNESFATFMETKMTDKLYPQWNIWSDFLLQLTSDAMNGDSLSNTHPIDVDVRSPEEVSQIFDEISYGKGASTLRMIEAYVGEEAFRIGVSRYLERFTYGNAEGANLWKSIAAASKQPVDELMEAWVKRPGYPLVQVSTSGNKLVLKQRRFLLSGESSNDAPWPIPLTALINGETKRLMLKNTEGEIDVGSEIRSLKLNSGQTGFYRVLYEEKLYSVIKERFASLAPFDKWGIVTDLFAFLLSGAVKKETYLSFVERCTSESEYIVIDVLADQLKLLKLIAQNDKRVSDAFFAFNKAQISRLGVEGKEGEPDTSRMLRGKIAHSLALHDDEFARVLATKFEGYDNVDPNIRSAVAVAYARTNGEPAFDNLVSTVKKMGNEADLIKLFNGLVSFKDKDLVKRALDLSLSGEFNRADAVYTIVASAFVPGSGETVWDWLEVNVDRIKETFAGTYILSSILQDVIPFAGLGREQGVREYFAEKKLEEASSGVNKGLELLGIYSRLVQRLR